jgi:predicted flap endonuclease-1-like 5' DNA nuclease
VNELSYYWGQIQAILARAKDGFAFAIAAARWAAKQVGQAIYNGDGPQEDARSELGTLQGMSPRNAILLSQAGITDLASLAGAEDIDALSKCLPLPRQTLYDWVDQAMLICAAEDAWLRSLRAIGIRTATDLRDAALDKQRLLSALAAAWLITRDEDFGASDDGEPSSASPFTLDALNNLLGRIETHPQWKPSIEQIIKRSLSTSGSLIDTARG